MHEVEHEDEDCSKGDIDVADPGGQRSYDEAGKLHIGGKQVQEDPVHAECRNLTVNQSGKLRKMKKKREVLLVWPVCLECR